SSDRTGRVWDAASGEPVTPPVRHDGELYCASFSPDGRRIVTTARDGSARVWEVPRSDWTTPDLLLLSQLLSGERADAAAATTKVDPAGLEEAWKRVRREHGTALVPSAAEAAAWHRREAHQCEVEGRWPSAVFHLSQLIRLRAGEPELWTRR